MKEDNKFNFFVPISIEKGKLDKSGYPEELIISGVASTKDEDEDGEILDPNGYILDDFLKYGFLNLEHNAKADVSNIVGEPIEARVLNDKLYIKGKLYKSNPKARAIYDAALMLEKEGTGRKLGYSIEGKKLKVDPANPKIIKSARLLGCAITSMPKNKNTFLSIVKGTYEQPYIEPEFDETANGGAEYLLDVTRPDGTRVTIDKEFNIKIDKAMSAGSTTGTENNNQDTNGSALKRESLRKRLVNLQPDFIKSVIEISKNLDKLDNRTQRKIRKSVESNLIISSIEDDIQKSWSKDLQDQFPEGRWVTMNGSRIFIHNGKVVAGLEGFNGFIDDFFSGKKEEKQAEENKKEIGDVKEEKKEEISIKKETPKAYLLERNGVQFWVQKRWYNEETGKLTPAGEKSLSQGSEKQKEKEENAKPVFNKNFKILGQSESGKATRIQAKIDNGIEEKEVSFYIPNSTLTNDNNKVGISTSMLNDKLRELGDKEGYVSAGKPSKVTDKGIGFNVYVDYVDIEKDVNKIMWFPKSQVKEKKDGEYIVPKWLFNKRKDDLIMEIGGEQGGVMGGLGYLSTRYGSAKPDFSNFKNNPVRLVE